MNDIMSYGCTYLMVICGIASLFVAMQGSKLKRYRDMLDEQYSAMFAELEYRAKQLDKDEQWLSRRAMELDAREDRIKRRENELNFLK